MSDTLTTTKIYRTKTHTSRCVATRYIGKIIMDGNRPRNHDMVTPYAIIRIKHGLITDDGRRPAIEYIDGSGHIERWRNGFPYAAGEAPCIYNLFDDWKEYWSDNGKLRHIEGGESHDSRITA